MGTHPIFESDFDCLTDGFRWGRRSYRFDLFRGSTRRYSTRRTKTKKQKGTGGMSFNVDLDETNEEEKNLQLAARLHRIKSEMRRSNIAAQKEAEKIERERLKLETELKTD